MSKVYSDEEIATIKERFLNDLWTLKPIKGKYKTKTYYGSRIECTNLWFFQYLDKLRVNKFYKLARDDFFGQVILICVEVMPGFSPNEEGFHWDGLLECSKSFEELTEQDKQSLKQIFAYLKGALANQLLTYNNWFNNVDGHERVKKINGENHYYTDYTKVHYTPLEKPLLNADGKPEELGNLQAEDADFFRGRNGYVELPFLKWFKDNKQKLLTKRRVEIFDMFAERDHATAIGVEPISYEEYGIDPNTARSAKFKMTKKINDEWDKVRGEFNIGLLEGRKRADLALYSEFMELIEREESDDEAHRLELTKWIATNMRKSRVLSDFLYDNLKGDDTENVVSGMMGETIPKATLYEISNIIATEIKKLKGWRTNVIPLFAKKDEIEIEQKPKKKAEIIEFPKSRRFNLTTFGNKIETNIEEN